MDKGQRCIISWTKDKGVIPWTKGKGVIPWTKDNCVIPWKTNVKYLQTNSCSPREAPEMQTFAHWTPGIIYNSY